MRLRSKAVCYQWLRRWQQHKQTPQTPRNLSIAGKVARGSWEHQTNVCALTTVSVFASELRLMLCCGQLESQGGENLLAPSLLELLDLEGAIVTGVQPIARSLWPGSFTRAKTRCKPPEKKSPGIRISFSKYFILLSLFCSAFAPLREILPFFIGQKFAVHGDDNAVAFGVFLLCQR